MDLSDSESRYYNDLFTLCDTDNTGQIPLLKAKEFFRSSDVQDFFLEKIYQLSGVHPSLVYLSRAQFYSCLKLIGAYQSSIPLREDILYNSDKIQVPLPKFKWNLELEPPQIVLLSSPNNSTQNGLEMHHSHDLIELSSKDSLSALDQTPLTSEAESGTSEVEHTDNERESTLRRRSGAAAPACSKTVKSKRSGSPETWSTASGSDSPTPTNSTHNSVTERPWANSQSWQGLLCEEQRQLLGTEEESSDKHSSDEDEDDLDLEALYQITPEQKEWYLKQFLSVQPNQDVDGLLPGAIARVFFEKSRIPVDQLRHIWRLCDVSRDGALDLAEFIAALHLVILRRNNIPCPSILPDCLQPKYLHKSLELQQKNEVPEEGDLLQLGSDENQESVLAQPRPSVTKANDYQRIMSSTMNDDYRSEKSTLSNKSKSSTLPKNHYSQHQRIGSDGDSSASNNSSKGTTTNKNVILTSANRSSSNSPPSQSAADGASATDLQNSNKEWTKFAESPTSNVSSPGPKPVNVTTNIIDPSHVIHPVPLRVTPTVATETVEEEATRAFREADSLVFEGGVIKAASSASEREDSSPKQSQLKKQSSYIQHQRDSLPNDLRAIQRPHPKKPASKNIGAIPLPPETNNHNNGSHQMTVTGATGNSVLLTSKKAVPLPPPRPHRHTRSSSLDLQRIKLSNNNASQDQETSSALPPPPELPPPRITDKSSSIDAYMEPKKIKDESFADFTQFPESNAQSAEHVTMIRVDSNPPAPLPRSNLTNTLLGSSSSGSQRSSAFEVYRKPSKSRGSQSPPGSSQSLSDQAKVQEYEKQVLAISDSLRQVRFRNASDQSSNDVLKHLKDQNVLLMRLCKDLSDELSGIQRKKEEIKIKAEK